MESSALGVNQESCSCFYYPIEVRIKLNKLLMMEEAEIDLCAPFVCHGYLQNAKGIGKHGILVRYHLSSG